MKTKDQKRREAAQRQAQYDSLTTEERAIQLGDRPGNSYRERERISRSVETR